MSLSDRNIGEVVNLRMLTKGYSFLLGSEIVAIFYHIYYKIMNTLSLNVKYIHNTLGYTTLIESNMFTNDTVGKRMIS